MKVDCDCISIITACFEIIDFNAVYPVFNAVGIDYKVPGRSVLESKDIIVANAASPVDPEGMTVSC